jgi:hypothetical protein
MKIRNDNPFLYFVLALFSLLTLYHSNNYYRETDKIIAAQHRVNKTVKQFRDTWNGLQSTIAHWNKRYVPFMDIADLLTLEANLHLERSGLRSANNQLIESKSDTVIFENVDIGLVYRCLKNESRGFVVEATSLRKLIEGLAHFDSRKDIKWDRVTLTIEKGSVRAIYNELCLYMRVSEDRNET